jgi:uncharacterized delta-60 repeat protein
MEAYRFDSLAEIHRQQRKNLPTVIDALITCRSFPLSVNFSRKFSMRFGFLSATTIVFAILAPVSARSATIDSTFHAPVFTHESPTGLPFTSLETLLLRRVIVLPDDSFVSFGGFTRLDGSNVGAIVKFNANGSRNQAFHFPDGYFTISAGAVTPDGHFIVAAAQQDKSGRTFFRILKLNADGSIDPAFNAGSGANDLVRSITLDSTGKVLLGGYFTKFSGTNRSYFVRLNADGSVDSGFAALSFQESNADLGDADVRASIVIPSDGKYLIAGNFSSINAIPRSSIARLNTDGSVDTTFVPSGFTVYGEGTTSEYWITDVALQPDERILASGRFASGQPFPNDDLPMVRLNTNGSFESFFGPPDHSLRAQTIKSLPNGDVFYADFQIYHTDVNGTVLPGFPRQGFDETRPQSITRVHDIDVQSTGAFLVAGAGVVDGKKRSGLARFLSNATLDSFNAGEFQFETLPAKIATGRDGKVYVGGDFDRIDGATRKGFARLQADGTLDAVFDPMASLDPYKGANFVLQPDGKLLIFGLHWDPIAFEDQFRVRRLTASGALDPTFLNDTEFNVFSDAVVQADGSYLAFNPYSARSVYEGTALLHISADGNEDPQFYPSLPLGAVEYDNFFPARVYAGDNRPLALLGQGKFLAKYFDATGNYRLVRMTAQGEVDSSFHRGRVAALRTSESFDFIAFDPNIPNRPTAVTTAAGAPISDVAVLNDGKIIVVGMFTKYTGVPAPGIVRLLPNGSIDGTFHPGGGAQWTTTQVDATHVPQIDNVEVQANGQLLVTGNFEAYNGVPANGIALLNQDGTPDATFSAPVVLRDFGPYLEFPNGRLYRQRPGNYLLSGRYAKPGEPASRSLVRLQTPVPAQALNISTRLGVELGDNVLIGGFIITGTEPKRVIVRAIGPSLAGAHLSNALADPTLELYSGGRSIASNDNWKSTQQADIVASGLAPHDDLESAIARTLSPGAYTAIVRGKNGGAGIGLVEVYDLDQVAESKLANISSRGVVRTGDNVMIGGFIVGSGNTNTKILVRALGPSLTAAGVAGALSNPTLELHNGNGALIASNDNWKNTQRAEIEATGIPPGNDAEAAILRTLSAGGYTAIVRGKSNSTGVALVEVYQLQ